MGAVASYGLHPNKAALTLGLRNVLWDKHWFRKIRSVIDIHKEKDAYTKVIEACKKYGKTPGMGGVYNEELMSEYIKMGMRFILSGSDLSFMMQSASQRSNKLRSFLK